MRQPTLFLDDVLPRGIVNVASVPHRSPFRYPGGKTWLIPYIRAWLRSLPVKPVELIEPFAGGGSVGLTAAFEQLAERVTLVELDDQVAAVWKVMLEGDALWLADKIAVFDMTAASVERELAKNTADIHEKAFRTILRNRVVRGGILAPGSGFLKYGENGKGIRSRWYPQTLRKRILDIARLRDRITFIEGDGIDILERNARRSDAVYFIDPPYTVSGKRAGSRLYRHNRMDHGRLFDIAESLIGDFLMTYDNTEEVSLLAGRHGFDMLPVAMKNTHHSAMTELLIGRSLDWARSG
ncbi:MAG: DNA adenine methylase [Armatimonadetes bacterium]|nr:DNA adenine methylase [Armatimonadota bacterium]